MCAHADYILLNSANYPLDFTIQNAKNLIETKCIRKHQLFALRLML